MLSHLKTFYMNHQIDITDIISEIKREKRGATSNDVSEDKYLLKAYWSLANLIFTAFYLDHSQNSYLSNYFAQKL